LYKKEERNAFPFCFFISAEIVHILVDTIDERRLKKYGTEKKLELQNK
jgi:hypothetical protein